MAKTLVYQIYLFGFLEKGESPIRFYEEAPIVKATKHLEKVKDLGVDVVWLGPIFHSPWCDHGYDIANYYQIDSRFGEMVDLDAFVEEAHQLGIKVIIDLVLNHTSAGHKWLTTHPEYYCWSEADRPGWQNLFNSGSAWKYDERYESYHLHLFHPYQADLNWFPDGPENGVSQDLVNEFHRIIDFWTKKHYIDGFRLDVPQSINKDLSANELRFEDLLSGSQATEVINAVFQNREDLFLIMECFDPTFGEITNYYAENTPVDFVLNVLIKDEISQSELKFLGLIDRQAKNPHFMLDLESHDAPRFPSREVASSDGLYLQANTATDAIWYLFNSGAEGICLYQGQELGLSNPSKEELPDDLMIKLDAQTAMRYVQGENLNELRPLSRANARVMLPLEEYERQANNPSSYLNLAKRWIERWRAN